MQVFRIATRFGTAPVARGEIGKYTSFAGVMVWSLFGSCEVSEDHDYRGWFLGYDSSFEDRSKNEQKRESEHH